jgi:hypothetical protein
MSNIILVADNDEKPSRRVWPRQDSNVSPAGPRSVVVSGSSARSPLDHLVPALHNTKSGRLDAARTAEWFGMPVKTIARLLDRGYATVHKTPDSVAIQDKLTVFLRIASGLLRLAGSPKAAKVWLNAPNPDLEDWHTPMSVIEAGEQDVIAELLEDALMGQPG